MIISQIIGGLGNQMFQYAVGRALALRREQPLLLDVSKFKGYELHQGFELQRVFDCPVQSASETDLCNILGWQFSPVVRRILQRPFMANLRRAGFVVEPHFEYWSGIDSVPKDCFLMGHWQSEKYFQSHIPSIRSDFSFKLPLGGRNLELAEQISQVNAVSLHVRRGDYVSNRKTQAWHGTCSESYYNAATEYIAERVENPCFFVFSDDMNWVRENLEVNYPCFYVEHNSGLESFNDMRLMSLCRHHIIANSSFSWWGAWLNPNSEKIVLAPKQWFAKQKINTKDLLPSNWVLLG